MESLAPEVDVKYHMVLWAPHYLGSLEAQSIPPAGLIAPRVPLVPSSDALVEGYWHI